MHSRSTKAKKRFVENDIIICLFACLSKVCVCIVDLGTEFVRLQMCSLADLKVNTILKYIRKIE